MTGANWLTGWGYRRSHLITAATGAGADYQTMIKVYKAGTANGTETVNGITAGKVSCDGHCRDDFADIRFTDDDGNTELYHWIESSLLVSGTSAVFWVKVNDSLESVNQTIYVYYSKSDAANNDDITNTFLFGDDFSSGASPDTNKWSITGSPTVSDGICTLPKGAMIVGKTNVGAYGVCHHFRSKYDSEGANTISIQGLGDAAQHNVIYIYVGEVKYRRTIKADASTLAGITWGKDVYYIGDQFWNSSKSAVFWKDGSTQGTNTTNVPATAIPVLFFSRATYGPNTLVDYTFVRKYVTTEPAHSTWGSEEPAVTTKTVTYPLIDVLFEKLGVTKTDSIDVLFKKTGITKTDSIDVLSKKLGIKARWLAGWTYRAFHQIDASNGASTDFQKRIVAMYPTDIFRQLRFATEIGTIPTPAGKTLISGQSAFYWDGGNLHIWFGASDDGTSDTDKIYYTHAIAPFTSWSTPVCVIDLTGSGIGVRDPTSYIEGTTIYLFLQGYTSSGPKAGPVKLYKTTKSSNFASEASYTYVSDPIDVGASEEFDEMATVSPCIMKSGSTYYMVYEALDDDGKYSIGRAYTTNIEGAWTKDGQLLDAGSNPIVNPFADTEGIVPDMFSSTTELYVHCQRPSGGKLSVRGVTGNFVTNSVAVDAYDMEPQIDGYYNHNNVNELGKINNIVYYLMQSWINPPSVLRVYACIDCVETNAHCATDFSDIRFVDGNGITLLTYWLEQKSNSDYAIFWVKIPNNLDSTPYNMYVYYGATVVSQSDIKNTSLYAQGDDFNDNSLDSGRWDTGSYKTDGAGAPIVTEQNARLEIAGVKSGDEAWVVSHNALNLSACVIRVFVDESQGATRLNQMGLWIIPTKYVADDLYAQSEWYRVLIYGDGNYYIQSKAGGTLYSAPFLGDIDIIVIKIVGNYIYFYEQDDTYPWLIYLRYSEVYVLSSSTAYIYLEGRDDDGTHNGPSWYDNEFMRKTIATEPVGGAWDAEETINSLSIDVVFKKNGITVTDSIDVMLKKFGVVKTNLIDVQIASRLYSVDSIDVLFKKLGITKAYPIDVGIALRLTSTDSIDILLKKLGLTVTNSVDTLFKKLGITKTEQIDVILSKYAIPITDSIDVLFKKQGLTVTDSIDVLFKKLEITKTDLVDVLTALRFTSENSIDVMLKKFGVTKTDNVDVLFKKLGITSQILIDIILIEYGATTKYSIDSLFKKMGVTVADSVDVLFKKLEINKIYLIDILTAFRLTKTDSIDVLFKKLGVTTTDLTDVLLASKLTTIDSIDTLFKKLGLTVTDSVDVLLEKLGLIKTYNIDVLVKNLGVTKVYLADLITKKLGIPVPYYLDVLFKKNEISNSYFIDVIFKSGPMQEYMVDALIAKLGITKSTNIDVLLVKLGFSETYDIDTILKNLGISLPTIVDTIIKRQRIPTSYSTDVLEKQLGLTKPYSIDALLIKLELGTYNIDAVLKRLNIPVSYIINVILTAVVTTNYSIDVVLYKQLPHVGYFLDVILVAAKILGIGGGHPIEMDRKYPEMVVKYIERNFVFKVNTLKIVSVRQQQKIPTDELLIAKEFQSKKSVSELKVARKSSYSIRTAELNVAKSYSQSVSLGGLAVAKEQPFSITLVELQLSKEQIAGFGIDPLNIVSERGMTFASAGLDIISKSDHSISIEQLSIKRKMNKRELREILNELYKLDE